MKRSIPFFKSTSNGNHFVIIDETQQPIIPENEKARIARRATNPYFGIGADALLVIQACTPEVLAEIQNVHRFWTDMPVCPLSDFILRVFEPNGDESYSCANGLLCVARYIHRVYGLTKARVLIEIPTQAPRIAQVGILAKNGYSWLEIDAPSKMPTGIVDPELIRDEVNGMECIHALEIRFGREGSLSGKSHDEFGIMLDGYLVYTGEPHWVVLVPRNFSPDGPARSLFIDPRCEKRIDDGDRRRIRAGNRLIHEIGIYVNAVYRPRFPVGINIDFLKIPESRNVIEYRCFERGINRETLSCGTGALAVAHVARCLNLIDSGAEGITIWPHRCRWDEPDSIFTVMEDRNTWMLIGSPSLICEGNFIYDPPTGLID